MNIEGPKTPTRDDQMYDVSSELQDIGLEDPSQDDHPIGTNYHHTTSPSRPSVVVHSGSDDAASVHDQLPSVEEHKAAHQVGGATTSTTSTQCRKISIVMALAIVVASILITIGVVIGKDSVKTTSPSSTSTSTEGLERMEEMITMITNMGWSAPDMNWDDFAAPQRRAVSWLVHDDPAALPVDPTEAFLYRYVLATLYYALNGKNWAYELEWLTGSDVCEWKQFFDTKEGSPIEIGVSCHDGEHIREIFLPKMNLDGTIPYEIGLLFDLEDLNLFGNNLRGTLPDSMSHLQSLEVLILHGNDISGSLPSWMNSLVNLRTLNVAENKFQHTLPDGMGAAMTKLQTLVLEHNEFTGTLEPLLNATNLQALYIGNNQFQGQLDSKLLGTWYNIQILDASQNQLSGSLPINLFATEELMVVDLHANDFSGHLPNLFLDVSPIEFLALQQNKLTGSIGIQIEESLTRLAHLDLSKNLFTGTMPKMTSRKTLKYLYLAFNEKFNEGTIPIEYATLPNLVDLSLQATNRIGTIPYQFEALENLVLFDLNSNALSGPLPQQLGEMTALQHLMLKDNKLNGTIPATFQGLSRLNTLLLDHNRLMPRYDSVCEPALPRIEIFTADCGTVADCPCCTKCCLATDTSCNNATWYSDVDPIANNGFVRDSYFFSESDIIFPAPRNVNPNYYQNYTGYYSKIP